MGAVLSDAKGRKMVMQLLLQRVSKRVRSVELQTWEMVFLRLGEHRLCADEDVVSGRVYTFEAPLVVEEEVALYCILGWLKRRGR